MKCVKIPRGWLISFFSIRIRSSIHHCFQDAEVIAWQPDLKYKFKNLIPDESAVAVEGDVTRDANRNDEVFDMWLTHIFPPQICVSPVVRLTRLWGHFVTRRGRSENESSPLWRAGGAARGKLVGASWEYHVEYMGSKGDDISGAFHGRANWSV